MRNFQHTMGNTQVERDRTQSGIKPLCTLKLIGPFSASNAQGTDLTPRTTKAKALLALLALAPRGSRSRVWLRDKLWSDRADEQAAASLRQALFEVRKSLGEAADKLILADKFSISLKLASISVDAYELLHSLQNSQNVSEFHDVQISEHFLEGIDVRDPEFESWLTNERQAWHDRITDAIEKQQLCGAFPKWDISVSAGSSPHIGMALQTDRQHRDADLSAWQTGSYLIESRGQRQATAPTSNWSVGLLPVENFGNEAHSRIIPAVLYGILAASLIESGDFAVWDFSYVPNSKTIFDRAEHRTTHSPSMPSCLVNLQARFFYEPERIYINVVLLGADSNKLLWSSGCLFDRHEIEIHPEKRVYRFVNRIIEAITAQFLRTSNEIVEGNSHIIAAINQIFRLSPDDLDDSEMILRELLAAKPSARAYAWLAFLFTFRIGQRFSSNDKQLIEEARCYAWRSLELDRTNSQSLSLVGYVFSYLFGEHEFADRLFRQSLQINPVQALSWDLYAMVNCFAGRPMVAQELASRAFDLGTLSPHRYYFDVTRCVIAALAGNHEAAISAGNTALLERPKFNTLLRYLISSHAHLNEMEKAKSLLARLEIIEPGFSVESLVDAGYAALETVGGEHFVDGLLKAGVKPR